MPEDTITFTELVSGFSFSEFQAYVSEYPEPVLLLEPPGKKRTRLITESTFDVSSANETVRLQRSPTRESGVFAVLSGEVHPQARVIWLKKTNRNPFPGMITIGREPNHDVVIPMESVSRFHALIRRMEAGWFLEDSRSSNGTFLDGRKVQPGGSLQLRDGSAIELGREVYMKFYTAESFYNLVRS
jgi:hypothetical protein